MRIMVWLTLLFAPSPYLFKPYPKPFEVGDKVWIQVGGKTMPGVIWMLPYRGMRGEGYGYDRSIGYGVDVQMRPGTLPFTYWRPGHQLRRRSP